jgi:spore coat polysaccharide biosynthesis predicted glycosyltransferase SpsG
VVLGSISPHNVMIENYAKDKNIKVIVNADNMAELMLEADLATKYFL